jgi:hypothetical protein
VIARLYVTNAGLPTARKKDMTFPQTSFVSKGSCAVSASQGRSQELIDVMKNNQSKVAKPVPQRSRQAGYVIPHASERLEVREPSGFTRNTEVEELERARDWAWIAHSVELKLEVNALAAVRRERKKESEINE